MPTTQEQIARLPEWIKCRLEERITNNLYDRGWCEDHRVRYENPDCRKAKELTFEQSYQELVQALQEFLFYEVNRPRNHKAERSLDPFALQIIQSVVKHGSAHCPKL